MRFLILFFTLIIPSFAGQQFKFDPSHTKILWSIDHAGYSKFIGEFNEYDGTLDLDHDNLENSTVKVTINPASVYSGVPALDKKLLKSNAFDVENHPEWTFVSTKVVKKSENTADVTGDLTIKGIKKPVTLDVTLNKKAFNKWQGKIVAGFSIKTTIKSSDFNVNPWLPAIGDDVDITIETEWVESSEGE